MIPRNHPQYVDIENFEDHELTICIAYEMAIRSPEVIKIINKNLHKNTLWYAIDVLCRVNLILSHYNIQPVATLSEINRIERRVHSQEAMNELRFFTNTIDRKIDFAFYFINEDCKFTDDLNMVYQFYSLVEKLQSDIDAACFEDAFIDLENIGREKNLDRYIESAQNIENFYIGLTEDKQNTINTLIELNIYKSDPEMHNDILFAISKNDAEVLLRNYYLDTFDKDGKCTMENLHILYSFIHIDDMRVKTKIIKNMSVATNILGDEYEYSFASERYLTGSIFFTDKPLEVLWQRPLLKMAKTVDSVVINLPKKDFLAQIEWIKKKYEALEEASKRIGISSIIFPNNKNNIKKPYQNKKILADTFFLYDNTKIIRKKYDKEKKIKQAKHLELIRTHKMKDQMSYNSCTYEEKAEELKNEINDMEEDYYKELNDYILEQLATYHNNEITVEIIEGKDDNGEDIHSFENMTFNEYYERIDPSHPNSLYSKELGEKSYPGMKKSSRSEKYKTIKEFIEEGKYKNLFF